MVAGLQMVGAVCLIIVVLTHVCEAFNFLPSMYWGEPRSWGHYLDLASAVMGIVLLSLGYLLRAGYRAGKTRADGTEAAHVKSR